MSKTLVAYFSASGVTRKTALLLAEALEADVYEIKPQTPYTKADLDWMDSSSRSTLEMKDPNFRPPISGQVSNMGQYDTVFVGFPIWWYIAPSIINTFLESYDFSGKTIIPFATSGGSGLGKTEEKLKSHCQKDVKWLPGKLLNRADKAGVKAWIDQLRL